MKDNASLLALATIRENRGISLQQIADTTKISVRALDAIEREQFQKLPGGIYSTSYIRQYARAIDYDESAILDVYYRRTGAPEANRPQAGGGNSDGSFGGRFRPASHIV